MRVGRPRLRQLGRALKTTRQKPESVRSGHRPMRSVDLGAYAQPARVTKLLVGSWLAVGRTLTAAGGLAAIVWAVPIEFTVGPVTIAHVETCQVPPTSSMFAAPSHAPVTGASLMPGDGLAEGLEAYVDQGGRSPA